MAGILAFFLSPIGRWIGIGAIILAATGGIYLKGRSDGKATYQAKLTREINKAIATGDHARTDRRLAGIAAARGKYVIMADSDDSYDLSNLGPFVTKLREGHDVVMGNR